MLIIEDVHWADEATIDLMVSLARRISAMTVMIVVSYRSDEVGADHSLRRFLDTLPPRSTSRIELDPISLSGVRTMSGLDEEAAGRDYETAFHYLREAYEYAVQNDLDSWSPYAEAYLTRAEAETGAWQQAMTRGERLLQRDDLLTITRISALAPLGTVKSRLGQPEGRTLLDEALRLAERIGELQRIGPTVLGLCEHAWLHDELDQAEPLLVRTLDLAMKRSRIWAREALIYWMWKTGKRARFDETSTPFGMQFKGDWRAAAEAWRHIGCPWEQAMALGEGDEEAVRQAVSQMKELGSAAGAEAIVRDARRRGIN